MASKSKLNLDPQDLDILYKEVEAVIAATRTPSYIKKVMYDYFLNEVDAHHYEKIHFIVTAQLRKNLEMWFDRQIDDNWAKQQEEIKESRKRGPRGPRAKIDTKKTVEGKVVTEVGGFKIRSS